MKKSYVNKCLFCGDAFLASSKHILYCGEVCKELDTDEGEFHTEIFGDVVVLLEGECA